MRDRGSHIIYVGISKNIRSRIDQHLNRRDSSVSTGVAAAMLNADKVASVMWWQHKRFDDTAILEAAEIVAFEILNPVLRSRGNVTERALLHLEDQLLVEELKALFGVGWWKEDHEQAAKMLESVGFSKNSDGKWLLPDGTLWTILVNAPADFEVLSQRLAFAVVNEWQEFGINAEVRQLQGGPFWTNYSTGEYDASSQWWPSSCAVSPDLFHNMESWHQKYIVAEGVSSGNNRERYSTPEISALIDQAVALPPEDPQVVELWTQVLQELVIGLPVIDVVGTSKFVPVNETYWTNFASADNYYEGPWWWWTQFKMMMAEIRPVAQ